MKYCHMHALALAFLVLCLISGAQAVEILEDGSPISLTDVSVTAVLSGTIYVEKTDRSRGIRVDTDLYFPEGTVVSVSGTIETDPSNDERYVMPSPGYPQATGNVELLKPLGLISRSFVGGESDSQAGITGDANLNTVGLLVTIWGRVLEFDPADPGAWCMVGDSQGPDIKIVFPSGMDVDKDWEFITATGICSVEKVNGSMVRVLKVRRPDDVVCRESRSLNRLQTMTLDQKIGQLFMIRFNGDVMDDALRQIIEEKHIGGIIYFQYTGNLDDPVRAANLSNTLQACAIAADGIPLLLSLDQEGGRVTRITGGTDFPGNMALGASRAVDKAYLTGSVIGTEIRAIGANMDLAPVLDVNNNPDNPVIGVRSFGEQANLASQMGLAYSGGLRNSGVVATGKHFPGHGDTSVDSHTGLPIVTYDFETLDTVHGKPFRDAIAGGLPAIMTAHIVVTCLDSDRPATLSPAVINGYLRSNLGFDGVVMTDSMGMAGITSGYTIEQASVMAVQAGVDIMALPPDLDRAINAIKAAVTSGDIPQSRIDESVARILRLKYRHGIFENPYVNASAAADIVGCANHWTAELSAARAGVTLAQNTSSYLPLNLTSGQKLLLVTVQASETTTDAATRFAAIMTQKHANLESMAIVANPNSSQRQTVKTAASSAAVVVVGTSRSQLTGCAGQATLVKELKAMGKPVVVVGLREPYELAVFPEVNAYVAAYNYRNCGFQAAADVIFGDWNPSAKLPVTIPGLYAFGHGLSY